MSKKMQKKLNKALSFSFFPFCLGHMGHPLGDSPLNGACYEKPSLSFLAYATQYSLRVDSSSVPSPGAKSNLLKMVT